MAKFNLRSLATEIRVMIYLEALNLMKGYDQELPPLLLALKGLNQEMYDEAYEIFLKVNYTLTIHGCKEFRQIPRKAMMKIRHLKIVRSDYNSMRPLPGFAIPNLTGHRATCINRFESITFDIMTSGSLIEDLNLLRILAQVSTCLRRIAIKCAPAIWKEKIWEWQELLRRIDGKLGLVGRLKSVRSGTEAVF